MPSMGRSNSGNSLFVRSLCRTTDSIANQEKNPAPNANWLQSEWPKALAAIAVTNDPAPAGRYRAAVVETGSRFPSHKEPVNQTPKTTVNIAPMRIGSLPRARNMAGHRAQ